MLVIFPHVYGLKNGNIGITQIEGVIRIHKDDDFIVKTPFKVHPAISCLCPKGQQRSIRFEDKESRDRVFNNLTEALNRRQSQIYIPSTDFYTSIIPDEEAFELLRRQHVTHDLYWQASLVNKRLPIPRLDAFRIFLNPTFVIEDARTAVDWLTPAVSTRTNDYVVSIFLTTLPIPKNLDPNVTPTQYFKYKCAKHV